MASIKHEKTTVIIIGNGPIGMMTSYCLSGNWPYWNGTEHPVKCISSHLNQNEFISLFQQQSHRLFEIGTFIEGRSSSAAGNIYDSLTAANELHYTDFLRWQHSPNAQIDHVVLGSDIPGGSWTRMEDSSVRSISTFRDLELPGLDSQAWLRAQKCDCVELEDPSRFRPTVQNVQEYYSQYPKEVGITEFQRPRFLVNSIQQISAMENPVDCPHESVHHFFPDHLEWQVCGRYLDCPSGPEVVFRSRHIVLALGRSHTKRTLDIEIKDQCCLITSLGQLKNLKNLECLPLLIVGAGLAAADKILFCRRNGISVIHVYRKTAEEASAIYSFLDPTVYPEYSYVKKLILSKEMGDDSWSYSAFDSSVIGSIEGGNQVWIKGLDDSSFFRVLACAVLPCLGYSVDELGHSCGLSMDDMILDSSTYESTLYPRLFVLGSLAGDKFVRFAKGGIIAAVSRILSHEISKNN